MRSIYRTMALIAACDDALRSAISAGTVTMAYYSPRGQEAVAAGFGAALRPDDYLVTTYRGLHDHIAKGVPLRPLLAEMLGRAAGTGKGKGGPMHVVWPDAGLMLTTGVVGSGLPIACRSGLGGPAPRRPAGWPLASFGDGATNIGAFHEACNLAAVWRLPADLPLPEQPLRRTHRLRRPPAHGARLGPRRRLRHARGDRRRQRPAGRPRGRAPRPSAGPAPVTVRR